MGELYIYILNGYIKLAHEADLTTGVHDVIYQPGLYFFLLFLKKPVFLFFFLCLMNKNQQEKQAPWPMGYHLYLFYSLIATTIGEDK